MVSTYSKPEPGEEILITGMSGKFPDCNDIYHFRDNLFNKVDMISDDHRRWKPTNPEVPQRTGKLFDIDKFDAGFFGVPQKHCDYMDPMCRMALERVYEALVDAGHHPFDLEGTETNVYVGVMVTETDRLTYFNNITNSDGITGCSRFIIAQRINYFFKLNGMGYSLDTACSSSLVALEQAYQDLRAGKCQKAIVCSANLCLHASTSLNFSKLGLLSADGSCKSFDDKGNGYVRSEAIMAIILEKFKHAKRAYAEVIHCKVNCDGYKDEGITVPSSKMQTVLIRELYQECNVDPTSVTFIECHGTGTKVGDPIELSTIDECFCKGRTEPLHIGAVKSNIGHTEAVAGLASITKILLGFESGFVPPNIHYFTPRKGIKGLENGMLSVVTEKIPWPNNNGLVGINSFGFGGANGHTLLRWNPKIKINDGMPLDNIPRLVCASGRSKDAVSSILNGASKMDAEFINLVHGVFRKVIPNQLYSGFAIIRKKGETERFISNNKFTKNRLRIVFSSADQKWDRLGEELMEIPLYFNSVQRIQKILEKELNVTISKLLVVTNGIIATFIVQLALADMIKQLNLGIHEIIGVGFGKLAAAYLNGFLSLEDVLLATYLIFFGNTKKVKDLFNRNPFQSNKWVSFCDREEDTKLTSQGSWKYFMNTVLNANGPEQTPNYIINEDHFINVIIGPWNQNCRDNDIMMIRNGSESIEELLRSLGRIFIMGFPANLDKLYTPITYPVSKGTPMLSPLIKWNHTKSYKIDLDDVMEEFNDSKRLQPVQISARMENWEFITGHVIDGKNIFPATGYLALIWEHYASSLGRTMNDTSVVFEDVKFHHAVSVPVEGVLTFNINIQKETKEFQIVENDTVLVTGKVYDLNEEHILTSTIIDLEDKDVIEMNEDNIYKKLQLAGYQYSNQFKGLKNFNFKTNKATIYWNGNWVTFMDNMLQVILLGDDIRNLRVPTSIKKVVIDTVRHIHHTLSYGDHIPVIYNKSAQFIAGGGIEITQLAASSIFRRKPLEPLLEIYKFVPYQGKLEFDQAVRCIVQIILENTNTIKAKSVELVNTNEKEDLVTPLVQQTLEDIPLIQSELKILSNEKHLHLPGIMVKNESLESQSGCLMFIASDLLHNQELLSIALRATRDVSGFIITKETKAIPVDLIQSNQQVQVLCWYDTDKGVILLIKESPKYIERIPINISSIDDLSWVETTKSLINTNVVLYTENNFANGALGLVNSLLKEHSENKPLAMLIMDTAPPFNVDDEFYRSQLKKNLAINVFKNGKWGSYRYLKLHSAENVSSEHCYANVNVKGDLSSWKWIQGPLSMTSTPDSGTELVQVHYSGINFNDMLIAFGRLSEDTITSDRKVQECLQGTEYSGTLAHDSSKRVMGIVTGGGLSTMVTVDKNLLWSVPNEWSLEDAVTVPVVYTTILYAFIQRGKMKRGQTILIHSGNGDLGQAAINVATYFGCTIFTTASTQEKKKFIKKRFPQIRDEYIGDSRFTFFEQMIHKETNGRGVDFVLNSLLEKKLEASVRCLAYNGTFLEIGKHDLAADKQLSSMLFKKQARYEGIMLNQFLGEDNERKRVLMKLLKEGISNGSVKPLTCTVFPKDKVGEAYECIATEKHTGKIAIKMRADIPTLFKVIPRFSCNHRACYVILGGLGGMGIELADWLMIRGAQSLVLLSRNGITSGFQFHRINILKSCGVKVFIRNDDVATEQGCRDVLTFAESLGPVEGIFNLAVVLKDGFFENQSIETFEASLKPKAYATRHLDVISRKICPKLRYFVVFSSIFCGRGNLGQTTYSMANSVMERICEKRKLDGYPALAIQWGEVGEVGLAVELQKVLPDLPKRRGLDEQPISNCLQVLDHLLLQNETIVSSMIIGKKQEGDIGDNMFDDILDIIGIRNLSTVSKYTTFAELGMDSMMSFEIKQTLERKYQKFLTVRDIRHMTIMKLQSLADQQGSVKSTPNQNTLEHDIPEDLQLFLRHIGDDKSSYKSINQMRTSKDVLEHIIPVIALSGMEEIAVVYETLKTKLNCSLTCIEFPAGSYYDSIEQIAEPFVKIAASLTSDNFKIIAYSFDCEVATKLMLYLESFGKVGKAFFIDGAPNKLTRLMQNCFPSEDDEASQVTVLCALMTKYIPFDDITNRKADIAKRKSLEDKIRFILSIFPSVKHSEEYIAEMCKVAFRRIKFLRKYEPKNIKLNSKITLIKPTVQSLMNVAEDYNLSSLTKYPVKVKVVEGSHVSMLQNEQLISEINTFSKG